MSQHEVLALNTNFDNWKRDRASGLTSVEPFLYYSVEHLTKKYNLTDDQVRYGITDHSNDGGVDAIYCLAGQSNSLIRDDATTSTVGIDAIRVMIFQVKSSLSDTGFQPSEIDKFGFFIDDLLDMSNGKTLTGKYTSQLLSIIGAFKDAYLSVVQSFPALHIEFFYVTKGDGGTLNTAAQASRDRVLAAVKKHRGTSNNKDTVSFNTIDTPQLLECVRQRRLTSRVLRWTNQPIPIGSGYVGVVKLHDYFDFLKNQSGSLDELIFESNVRGNQGRTSVNKQMRAALDAGGPPDFWQLNNGVTITCTNARPIDAYSLSIEDAQVVNGLQTSRQVFAHFSESKNPSPKDQRVVLVKLIPVSDDAVRDKIIRATNNQNPIKSSVLLLTGEAHRDIEDLFRKHDLFYDRRPGFYKDQGQPISRIVSLNEVTQAAITILLHRPDDARARPGNYLGAEPGKTPGEKHTLLFRPRKASRLLDLSAYLKAVLIVRKVEDYIKGQSKVDYSDRRNILFYVAFYVACKVAGSFEPSVDDVFKVRGSDITKALLSEATLAVMEVYAHLSNGQENRDVVAKGPEMLAMLKKKLPKAKMTIKHVGGIKAKKKIKDVLKSAEFIW